MALESSVRHEQARIGPANGPGDRPVDPGRDVVVLLPGVPDRSRVVAALERAGYRVVAPRERVAWRAGHTPILVTDDTDGASRVRAEVVAVAPTTACVVLVREPTPARYRQILASGATALPASSADEDLVQAVGAAARSLACLPVAAARAIAGAGADRPVLTDREVSWLRALVDGATVAGLARAVGYSQREMYRVLANLYARLGADNRTGALLHADRWGLLTPSGVPAGGTGAGTPRIPTQRGPARG